MEKKHYNLYYIFKEDKQAHPMPPPKVQQILQVLLAYMRKKEG